MIFIPKQPDSEKGCASHPPPPPPQKKKKKFKAKRCEIARNGCNDVNAKHFNVSRHTVVCRAAQEAGAQPREYIDRNKENAIFAPP